MKSLLGKRGSTGSMSSEHSSSDGSSRFNMEGGPMYTNAVSNKGLIMMTEAYELQVDNSGVVNMSRNPNEVKISPQPNAKKDVFSPDHMTDPISEPRNITPPTNG